MEYLENSQAEQILQAIESDSRRSLYRQMCKIKSDPSKTIAVIQVNHRWYKAIALSEDHQRFVDAFNKVYGKKFRILFESSKQAIASAK